MLYFQKRCMSMYRCYCADTKHYNILLGVLALGFLVRLALITRLPGGLNQDETYAGYEAFSMLKYGTDSWGYRMPVYFVSWGSGMNVLNSYLMIPFIAILGPTTLALRLPQALLGCASLVVFYLLLKELFSKKAALAGLIVAAVCPWHIMMSRWGLESNIAPGMLLFGFYFFMVGLRRPGFLIASAVSYGLCLYAYATMWAFVPFLLGGQIIFALCYKKLKFNKFTVISAAALAALGIPLILFLLVQSGRIPEIRTFFMSIPKMPVMRDSDFAFQNFGEPDQYRNLFDLIIKQFDGGHYNSLPNFGLYYLFSLPLAIYGVRVLWKRAKQQQKNRVLPTAILPLYYLAAALALCVMISRINVNRINALHFAILIPCGAAIGRFFEKRRYKPVFWAAAAAYAVSFLMFINVYTTKGPSFQHAEEPLRFAASLSETSPICITTHIYHPTVLYCVAQPTDEYVKTVVYDNPRAPWMSAQSFGRFTFGDDVGMLDRNTIYIIENYSGQRFREAGFTVKQFDGYSVAYI